MSDLEFDLGCWMVNFGSREIQIFGILVDIV